MFLYRVKYTESEYDIQNNDLLYKIYKQDQNAFDILEIFVKKRKFYVVIYIMSIIHI